MPRKTPSKPLPFNAIIPTAPLLDKLGVKPGQKILILGVADNAFINDIQPNTAERKPAADIDLIFFKPPSRKEI